jgi:hypothetical protein
METFNGCVEDLQPAEPGLSALLQALNSRERALTELTDVVEGQVAGIGGVVLVLRALIDLLLDEEQRAVLMSHLTMTLGGNRRRGQSIVDILFE